MGNISAVLLNAPAALAQAQVMGLSGQEGISQLFCFQIDIIHPVGGIAIAALPGESLAVKIIGDDGIQRYFHGRIADFSVLGAEGRYFRYRFTLRPALWFRTLNRQCRIFQSRSVIDVIKSLLEDDVSVDWKLQGRYDPVDYCVQYLESDLDFICRLMEEQGLFFFFRHSANGHQLVISDSGEAHRPIDGCQSMAWFPGEQGGQSALLEWRTQVQWRRNTATARDFDFTKAMSREAGLLHARTGEGDSVWLDYPAKVESRADAQMCSMRRSEALQTDALRCQTLTRMPSVEAGGIIALSEHFDDNVPGNYVVLEAQPRLQAQFSASGACNVRFDCQLTLQKEGMVFRPPRVTPRPVIAGCQTAMVTGKEGEALWVDRYGRIKIQFHWDSGDNKNEACSCWVRVAQSVAGERWGSLFLPRPGQEVVVVFLDGDPDRPLVTGCVYNAGTPPPYTLPGQGARSGFRTRSFGDSGVFNELRFDDKAGAEQLLLRAGRNKEISVVNDALEWVGNERHLQVKKSQFIHIGGDAHSRVAGKAIQRVDNDLSLQVGGKGACKVDGSLALAASKIDAKSQSSLTLEAGVRLTLKAGSSTLVLGPEGVSVDGVLINIKASGLVNINSGGGGKAASAETPRPASPQQPKEADDGSR